MKKNKFQSLFSRISYLLLFLATIFGIVAIFTFSNNSSGNSKLINHDLVINQPKQVGKIRPNFDHNFSSTLLSDGGYIVANADDLGISRIDNFGNVLWQYISKPTDNLDFKIVSVIQNSDLLNQFFVLSVPTVAPTDEYNFINDSNFLARLSVINEDLSQINEAVLKVSKQFIISPQAMIQNIPQSWATGRPSFLSGSDLVKADGTFGYSYNLYMANMGNLLYFKNNIFIFGNNGFNGSYSLGVYRVSEDSTINAWPYAALIQNWKNIKSLRGPAKNADFPIFQDNNLTYAFRGAIAGVSVNNADPGLVTIGGIFTIGSNNSWNAGNPLTTRTNQNINNDSAIIGFFKLSLTILSQKNVLLQSASDSSWYNFGSSNFLNTKNQIANIVKANASGNFSIANVAEFQQISNRRYVMQFMNTIVLISDNPYNLYQFFPYALLSDYNNWNYFIQLLFIPNLNLILTAWNEPNKFSNNTTLYLLDLNQLNANPNDMIEKNNDLNLKILNAVLISPVNGQFYVQAANNAANLSGLNLVSLQKDSNGKITFDFNQDFSNSLLMRNQYLGSGQIRRSLPTDILKLSVSDVVENINNLVKIRDPYVANFISYSLPNRQYNATPKVILKVESTDNNSISFESFVSNPLTNSYSKIPGLYSIYTFTGFNTTPPYILIIVISVVASVLSLVIIISFIVGFHKRRKRILTMEKLTSKYKD